MKPKSIKYNHIAIEGNIGSGKTTLAKKLSKDLNSRLLLEEFAENPFLPKFYKSPEENAFPLELFFMAERYHQLKNSTDKDLFMPLKISDYFFVKSRLFAKNNLTSDQFNLFDRLFKIMFNSLDYPDLVIYLYASVERLKSNIKQRGRVFEQNINNKYLNNIQDTYLDYFKKQNNFPVVVIDVTDIDFKHNTHNYQMIKNSIYRKHEVGINKLKLF
jgi:deoxyadenosine/deoxycytidine kinase